MTLPASQTPSQSCPSPPPPGTTCPATHRCTPPHYKNLHPSAPNVVDPTANMDHQASPPSPQVLGFRSHTPGAPMPYIACRYPIPLRPVDTRSPSTHPPDSSPHQFS